jgi:hypothetical protein
MVLFLGSHDTPPLQGLPPAIGYSCCKPGAREKNRQIKCYVIEIKRFFLHRQKKTDNTVMGGSHDRVAFYDTAAGFFEDIHSNGS